MVVKFTQRDKRMHTHQSGQSGRNALIWLSTIDSMMIMMAAPFASSNKKASD